MPEVDDEEKALQIIDSERPKHIPASTLLPAPVASLVTLFTDSASLSLRFGTFVGGFAIDGARITTLAGLELSRAAVEAILSRAGRDVANTSTGELGRVEAESILERSITALHSTITSVSFFASASFHLSSATLSSVSTLSQHLLSSLDAILGSTESSRAIAAIITLIRREFQNPETGNKGERVGVADLLVGLCGFALLQRWGKRKTERAIREKGGEEIIWDVVILDNGVRADVVGTQRTEYAGSIREGAESRGGRPASFLSTRGNQESFEAVERIGDSPAIPIPRISLSVDAQSNWSDEEIRLHIMNQLPHGAHASVKTETVTAKTITVDVFDAEMTDVSPPPGTMMIEERFHHLGDLQMTTGNAISAERLPQHTMVFQTALNRVRSADLRHEENALALAAGEDIDNEDSDSKADSAMLPDRQSYDPPPFAPSLDHFGDADEASDVDMSAEPKSGEPTALINEETSIPRPVEKKTTASQPYPATKANKKRPRKPVSSSSSLSGSDTAKGTFGKSSFSRLAQKVKPIQTEKPEKRAPLAKAFKKTLSPSHSTAAVKDLGFSPGLSLPKGKQKAAGSAPNPKPKNPASMRAGSSLPRPLDNSQTGSQLNKTLPRVPQRNLSPTLTRGLIPNREPPRSESRTSYYSVHEKHRESLVAQTDTYSIQSIETRTGSPTFARTRLRTNSGLSKTKSEKNIALSLNSEDRPGSSASKYHRRSKSYVPSLYSLATTTSQTSLVLAPRPRKSVYEDQSTILALNRNGRVPGIFPDSHLVRNVRRFSRFSSASYGSYFLRLMGIAEGKGVQRKPLATNDLHHFEHSSFSSHTGLPASTILLSSFVDPAGGSNAAGETASGLPLIHYLSIDHDSKAVVLTCRGTLGFEDILTDMTCDYDSLQWQGRSYQVHKGMHASARRLLEGGGGRVMVTIKAALEEFTDYGLVFCGHSLGGGVTALLATLISEPNKNDGSGTSFVTAPTPQSRPLLLTAGDAQVQRPAPPIALPPGRPIHVYAYGPPATVSPHLRLATRGLVTTIVNGQDVVPYLSLGNLHDFQSVALAFKTDTSGAKSQVRARVWQGITSSITNRFYVNQPPPFDDGDDGMGEDFWAWSALKTLRAGMLSPKLLPPGEVFVVETMRVLQRDAFTSDAVSTITDGYPRLGRPATRVQIKFVKDVETRFGEIHFGSGMLTDHSPGRYEASLAALARGVLEDS